MNRYYSNGKLLLTAEYVVLDGALALALPSKFGQDLCLKLIDNPLCVWESFDSNNKQWFKAEFKLPSLKLSQEIDLVNSNVLQIILCEARKLNPEFLNTGQGYHIKTYLSFPRLWGLGTSSTLINNIAQWAKVDAFKLQFNSFGGSAYDIACAQKNHPILYRLQKQNPKITIAEFSPKFKDKLFFVYLNKKQNSREEIKQYDKLKGNISQSVLDISNLTKAIAVTESFDEFEKMIAEHEQIISKLIKKEPIQKMMFKDYFGQTKSLGAWGGDFILATGNADTPKYFKKKGFETVVPYSKMVL